jgi:hypothetical protein
VTTGYEHSQLSYTGMFASDTCLSSPPQGGDEVEVDGDEWGDWLDEFVATAAQSEGQEQGGGAAAVQIPLSRKLRQGGMGAGDEVEDGSVVDDSGDEFDEEEEEEEEEEGRAGSHSGAARGPGSSASQALGGARYGAGRAASIASSYWRPERSDRKGALDVIDARFDKLTAQYEVGGGGGYASKGC